MKPYVHFCGVEPRQVSLSCGLADVLSDALVRIDKPRDPRAARNVHVLLMEEGGALPTMSASGLCQPLKQI